MRTALVDENDLPDLAALKAQAAAVPTRTTRVPIWRTRAGREVRVAVHESGGGRRGRLIVLVLKPNTTRPGPYL